MVTAALSSSGTAAAEPPPDRPEPVPAEIGNPAPVAEPDAKA